MEISKNNTLALKGLCILLIVLHHYAQNFGFLPDILRGVGPIGCAVFFFISGYGLTKGPGDVSKWKKRFLRLYVPFLLANVLYLLFFVFVDCQSFSVIDVFRYLIGLPTINKHWFIQVLLLLYLAAFVTDIIFLSDYRKFACLSILLGGAFSCITNQPGSMSWIAFPLGIICANMKIKMTLKMKYFTLLLTIPVACLTFYFYYYVECGNLNKVILIPNFILMCLFFPFMFLGIGEVISSATFFKKMGKYSIDVYFSHFLVIFFLKHLQYQGACLFALFVAFVVFATLLFGFARNSIFCYISSK